MDQPELVLFFVVSLFLLLSTGVWIGLALIGVGAIIIELFISRSAGDGMILTMWSSLSSWTLVALPLFIWTGEILFRTRLSEEIFRGLSPWMRNIPGGLLHTNILGSAIFAAVCGSSAATCATIGRISIGELLRRNYPENLVISTLAGAATLGFLIPPSLIFIVYGVTINESISKLFIAGVIPGIVLTGMFMIYIAVKTSLMSDYFPEPEGSMSFRDKISAARFLFPIGCLIILILGSIYSGVATATEAAGLGVFGALILAYLQGSLNTASFVDSIMSAIATSAMIGLILAGSAFLGLAMGFTGLPHSIVQSIDALELSRSQLLISLLILYIVLGCFLDGISCIVLTLPVVEPLIQHAAIDAIWFGVFMVVVVEMAQITPPVGFNLFVLQGLVDRDIYYIARCSFPMFLILILMVFILIAFPELATWLPAHMRHR